MHPLICHAIDTAAVTELLFAKLLTSGMVRDLKRAFAPVGDARVWVAIFAGLHDLGKLSPAFQALRRDLLVDWLDEPMASRLRAMPDRKELGQRVDTPHGVLTAMHVQRILCQWGASLEVAQNVAYALGGHHGFFPRAATVIEARQKRRDHGEAQWADWCDDFVARLLQLHGLELPSPSSWERVRLDLGLAVTLAGLTAASDQIASDPGNFPYVGAPVDLDLYVTTARDQAKSAVERLRLKTWRPPEDTSFASLFEEDARPVQQVVESLGDALASPTLLIIEAPTGEGKTKAALQAAARMTRLAVDADGALGMYFASPTKATSNQAYREIKKLLQSHQPDLVVRLLHGSAAEVLAAEDIEVAVSPVNVSLDEDAAVQAKEREWFRRYLGLLAPMGAGTWDQVLMAGIRSKHVFTRMTGLSGKVVVIDEVHALDTYMSTLLDRVVQWLGLLNVSVILLSATLPANRRDQLISSWRAGLGADELDDHQYEPASAYPRITYATSDAVKVVPAGVSPLNSARLARLEAVPDEELVDWLIGKVREGGCLAVVHNLVRRVEQTHAALEEAIKELPLDERPELFVITGQLTQKARHEVEEQLRERFGPPLSNESDKQRRPLRAIVVGTQVLESSLDLDFDALVSDLAPIDSIIQRMGRVQRHGDVHQRFTHLAELCLAITGVQETPQGPVLPLYTGSIYPRALTWRTWAVLRERTHFRSPEDVPQLIEQVYGERPVSYPPGWRRTDTAEKQWARKQDRQSADVRVIYLPLPTPDRSLKDMTVQPTQAGRTRSKSGAPDRG
ncbi:CRISPR-associated helicase/endonuclease Cas3 [Herbidospora sp. RD11066]